MSKENRKKRICFDELPIDVQTSLVNFGKKITIARRSRLLTQAELAARIDVGLNTMISIEQGSPSVQFGSYVMALWCLNLLDEFERVARPEDDPITVQIGIKKIGKVVQK
ncbi:MAG: hypothetical protein WC742_12870 [Gallionellaceae bacterium]|jgi:DNA-binding XRE family transcriptional regulator